MISIVVAVYNIESLLHHCVDSVLRQDDTDWELILVNDGSEDNSDILCRKYASADSRIKYVKKENGGLSSARNAGIRAASGEWIIFVDGDDYLLPNTISTLKELIQQSGDSVDLVQYGFLEVANYELFRPNAVKKTLIDIVEDRVEMFERLLYIGGEAASGCTKLIKMSVAKSLLFKEGIIHEDEEFTTRPLFKVNAVAYTDFKPYVYVRRKNSITTSCFSEKRLDIIKIMLERIELLERHGYNNSANKYRLKFIRNLYIIYMAARAVNNKDACIIISQHLKKQLEVFEPPQNSLSRIEATKYKLIRLGIPIQKLESLVRSLLNKQIHYE